MRGSLPNRSGSFANSWWLGLALIALAVASAYSNTLHVPFYLDDFSSIRENDLIYRWRGIIPLWRWSPTRVIGYLSFALNYKWGRFDLLGYHVVNALIHGLAGVAVWGLARGIVRTPRVRAGRVGAASVWLPLVTALMFALHPLQTQAVTYTVQRLASLVALFYLTALASYVQARLAPTGVTRALWSSVCVLAALLAFLSKENSATLPAAIWLTEVALLEPSRRRAGVMAGVAFLAMGVLWTGWALVHMSNPLSPGAMDQMSRETLELSRVRYLATQMCVVLHYLRLFVLPTGLHLDYAFPLRDGFLHADVLLAMGFHAALLGLAVACWRRRPAIAYGVMFYYLAHAVESSVIPIRDVIFEHRAYLPNFGLCLGVAWWIVAELARSARGARLAWGIVPLILVIWGAATWQRNQEWRDPIRLWQGNAALAPTKPRVWAMLGRYLLEANRPQEGAVALETAMRLRAGGQDSGSDRDLDAINMMWALRLLGRYDEALALNAQSTRHEMAPWLRSTFLINEGNVYFDQRRFAAAESAFRKAIELVPASVPAMANLASACAQSGRLAEADSLCLEVLAIDPSDQVTRFNLWQVRARAALGKGDRLRAAGRTDAALDAYRAALQALEEAVRVSPDEAAVENAKHVRALIEALESGAAPRPVAPHGLSRS